MAVFAPYLKFIWESAGEFGIDPEKLFAKAAINPTLRHDPNARISADQLDRLIWIAKQESHDDAFAFHLVERVHPSYYGVMGYAWLASETLRKAFELLCRYQKLLSDDGIVHLEDTGTHLKIELEWQSHIERDPALRERVRLSNVVRLCRMNCGESFKPDKVFFMQEEPAKPAAYYTYFRCELEFGAEASAILIDAETADHPLPGYDPRLLMLFEKQIIDYLAKLNKDDIVGQTKSIIFDQLPFGQVAIDQIAERLFLSERTLRRRLKEASTSFKDLLAETRRELGERYIQDSSLSLTEIAYMLGFSDSSSLSRAYKNWTGKSPSEHRNQQGAS
jgi:AraC-like DNA-binding protein